MKILSIDTASSLCSVSLLEDQKLIDQIALDEGLTHSEKLMPMIEKITQKNSLDLSQIDLFVCDKGPGSFTGIRIGIATIKAFSDSLLIPSVGISSLETLAYSHQEDGYICSLIDAKHDNVYVGLFSLSNHCYTLCENLSTSSIEEVILALKQNPKLKQTSSPITFIGDGSIVYQEILKKAFSNAIFGTKNELNSYYLGLAGRNHYLQKKETSLSPLYLKKSQAERALEERKHGN